jgi:hypothetical protein
MNTCETCGGPLVPLGTLGNLMWFRCRDCGQELSANASREEQHARYIDCGPLAWDDRGGSDEGC